MSESDDRYQSTEDKEQHATDDKDVEGHQQIGQGVGQGAPRAADGETDEADVEGHGFHPQTD
jgi:hypothetical protein